MHGAALSNMVSARSSDCFCRMTGSRWLAAFAMVGFIHPTHVSHVRQEECQCRMCSGSTKSVLTASNPASHRRGTAKTPSNMTPRYIEAVTRLRRCLDGRKTATGSRHVTTDALKSFYLPSLSQQRSCFGYESKAYASIAAVTACVLQSLPTLQSPLTPQSPLGQRKTTAHAAQPTLTRRNHSLRTASPALSPRSPNGRAALKAPPSRPLSFSRDASVSGRAVMLRTQK